MGTNKKAAANKAAQKTETKSTQSETPVSAQPKRSPGIVKDADAINRTPTRLTTNSELADRQPVAKKSLSAKAKGVAAIEDAKEKTFDDLGVPAARRGENLHEQNPELSADIARNQRKLQHEENLPG